MLPRALGRRPSRGHVNTANDLLQTRAEQDADRVAYRFLDYGASAEPAVSELTYAELDRRARDAAAALTEAGGRPGDRVLLLCSPGLRYLTHFFGCLYAGMIAVPAFPPGALRAYDRIDAIAQNSGASLVLADDASGFEPSGGSRLSEESGSALANARWLSVQDSGGPEAFRDWEPVDAAPETLAFFQYTSGSTSAPKAVMVSQGNLIANARAAEQCFGLDEDSNAVNWVPPYHDMGLIGAVIYPLYSKFTSTHMAPASFIRSPLRWLEAITRFQAQSSAAPDFAYRMCAERISESAKEELDLSHWRLALSGSEPVRAEVLDLFARAFEGCGFRKSSFVPCYGMAENTLVISAKPVGSGEPVVRGVSKAGMEKGRILPALGATDTQPLTSCGSVAEGVTVQIVEPGTSRSAAPDAVGEIWVRGPSVAEGYYQADQATEETFRRALDGGEPGGSYLRTGDLGAFIDGELYVTGRADDMMIFRGRNIYPQDVESTSCAADPLLKGTRCAAFAVEEDGETELVVVQEMRRRNRTTPEDLSRIAAAIRARISGEHQITPRRIVLAPPGAVPTTSSGKVRRKACRARYLEGGYPEPIGIGETLAPAVESPVADAAADEPVRTQAASAASATTATTTEIEAQLRALIAQAARCGIDAVSPEEPFGSFGLDSVQAVNVAQQLSERLGRAVPATLAWEFPDIRAAARSLATPQSGATRTTLVSPATAAEPIAVVGIGCRLPGGSDSPEAFWDLLINGRNAITEIPADRWDLEAYYDPDPDAPARTYARHGAFIDNVRDFDAALFNITPREAASIDPQHRLLLETTWHALEHAQIPPDSLRGTNTGVFIGLQNRDFERLLVDKVPLDAYTATGTAPNFAANRVSFAFGLQGPSLVVDTACSSSLVAAHLACQALRNGECDTAIVGGANLILSPDAMIALTKGRMLSPTGQCHTFDTNADGYVRGEGAGIIILKRQTTAQHHHNPILALIRSSAVNQDGRSNGLTAPSGAAQEDVIARALAAAGLEPDQIGYVEAHGTGTALGDPIEIQAINHTLTPRTQPLHLGSVKTNIGHLEAAAGIAALIKTTLTLHHATIPPHLNLTTPNPLIPFHPQTTIPTTPTPWNQTTRTAGISSFGFGGTNAHLILQNHTPEEVTEEYTQPDDTPYTITLTAHTPHTLHTQATTLQNHLTTHPTPLHHLAWTTTHTRSTLPHRATITTTNHHNLTQALTALTTNTPHPDLHTHHATSPLGTAHVAFLLPGHGTRLRGALRGLYGVDSTITEALDSLAPILGLVTEPPISILIDKDAPKDLPPQHIQPALYAMGYALAAWWRARGVVPQSVLGHSAGAYGAAALAGIVSVEDGARLAQLRGGLVAQLPGDGAMAAVFCEPSALADLAPIAARDVEVAVYNSPSETVVAGPPGAVQQVIDTMAARGVRSVRLTTPAAFHSAQVDQMLPGLHAAFAASTLQPSTLPFISDTTGLIGGPEVATPDYWARHTRKAVHFDTALATLYGLRPTILLELGPGGLLTLASRQPGEGGTTAVPARVASLSSERAEPRLHLETALGQAWAAGAPVDWSAHLTRRPAQPPQLPLYPFERREHWPAQLSAPTPSPVKVNGHPVRQSADVPVNVAAPSNTMPNEAELARWLRAQIARALGLERPEDIDADAGLFDLGITSVMTTEIRAGLQELTGLELPVTLVFDHPTIRRLSAFLAGQAFAPAATTEATAAPATTRRVSVTERFPVGTPEPIAIIGMGCRLPGGVVDPDTYWALLDGGVDAIRPVPADRWDADAYYDPAGLEFGKANTRHGGFLTDPVDLFDADAFGISPREARGMDPQQRLLLEVAWEALDDAGYPAGTLRGTNTGVYLGISTQDYQGLLAAGRPAADEPYLATGTAFSVAAGRLSYLMGAEGPSMAVDTACSSSLVAAHLAVRALRSGETDLAVVGGVNLMLSPNTTVSMSKLRALSPDGRCKAFAAAADGYGRGEGCGVVVLKRLSDARAAGDRIWALIRGSAVNQDGRSAGLTVPSGTAQQAVIRAALRDGSVGASEVGYVEAHGTGTPLGDPLEISALAQALRPDSESDSDSHFTDPVLVGSVKTNIGHLEAAAGVAGMIKATLTLHRARIPAHLNVEQPSPLIEWDRLPVRLALQATDWNPDRGARVAGVSSFAFSGTNAHIVMEEAPDESRQLPEATPSPTAAPRLLVVSARSPEALNDAARAYRDLLTSPGTHDTWPDIARTAALHRDHLPHRLALVAANAEQAASALATLAEGGAANHGARLGHAQWNEQDRLIAVFAGQGSQWPGMGRGLDADPVAAGVLERCEAVVQSLAGWSLIEQLSAPRTASRMDDTAVAQPAMFAVQAALAEIWRHRGVRPDAVVGHSAGEVAAAYVAGVFDLETACAIAVRRGEAMSPTRGTGAMAAAGISAQRAEVLLAQFNGAVTVAAVNSPAAVVLAGDRQALDELERQVRSLGSFWAWVQEVYAFHHPGIASRREPLIRALTELDLRPQASTIPFFSTVLGTVADTRVLDPDYWARNMIQPVLFSDALRAAAGPGRNAVLEIGPQAVLSAPAVQTLDTGASGAVTAIRSMQVRRDPIETMLDAAGALHVLGYELDHRALHPRLGQRASLPAYPWQRQRYWVPLRPAGPGEPLPGPLDDESMAHSADDGSRANAGPEKLIVRLRDASPAKRARLLEDLVQAEVAAVLGRPAGFRLDRGIGFFDAGMDSITSVELRGRLVDRTGVQIAPTAAFEHPSIAAMAGFLLTELSGRLEPPAPVDAAAEPEQELFDELAAQLEAMSEDELMAMLLDELEEPA